MSLTKPSLTVPDFVKTSENAVLTWEAVTNATGYSLERMIDGGEYAEIYSGTALTYTDETIKASGGNLAEYRLKATSENESSDYSVPKSVPAVYFWVDGNGILQPCNLLINFTESDIPALPEIEDTAETVAGADGEISLNTRYGARIFSLVCYSNTVYESVSARDTAISDTAKLLHSTKNSARYMLWKNDLLYKVKIVERPMMDKKPFWYGTTLQLKSHNPIGYSTEEYLQAFASSGVEYSVTNEGDEKAYPVIIISGACTAPSVTVNGTSYATASSFAMSNSDVLTLDCERSTAILNYGTASSENAMQNYIADTFPVLNVGTNTIQADTNTIFKWRERNAVI
jgi:phage-related protein